MKPLEYNNEVILMVDDELDILELFRECLESEGYNVQLFTEPSELLNIFTKIPTARL